MSFTFERNCRYSKSHEWVRLEGDIALAGITDYAQDQLSDIVYVELPEPGDSFEMGDVYAVVESVKAAADCDMPISGEVLEVNDRLEDRPQVVNEDPFGEGWFIQFRPMDVSEVDSLMDADAYEKYCTEETGKEGGH